MSCQTCGTVLIYDFEEDQDMCGECQDRAIAKWRRMSDWKEFHGDWHDEESDQ